MMRLLRLLLGRPIDSPVSPPDCSDEIQRLKGDEDAALADVRAAGARNRQVVQSHLRKRRETRKLRPDETHPPSAKPA
jgi:hypothetical protein